jgi:tRNA nucleotidyltransferase (CCA-adding enzyme)
MYVDHGDIARFAEKEVNLPSRHASSYRDQVKSLTKKLEEHIGDNPDYHLKRIMLSGSLAKRTSLKSISDADMAVYVKSDDAPQKMSEFLEWLADELATLYKNVNRENIEIKTYSISINFTDNDLDVDVVPIYWISSEWDGDLISQDDGTRLRTNIPQHLKFMKTRHDKNSEHFRQVIRLIKYWVNIEKEKNSNFRFKSFMVELIVAHLADNNRLLFNDYPEALRQFFDYLQMSNLDEVISFNDFGHGTVQKQNTPINIFDPVNQKNNVSDQYNQQNKDLIMDAAMNAADAIEFASCATTKEIAITQWRKVFGNIFNA